MAELISFENLLQVLQEYGEAIRNEYQDNLIRSERIAHNSTRIEKRESCYR